MQMKVTTTNNIMTTLPHNAQYEQLEQQRYNRRRSLRKMADGWSLLHDTGVDSRDTSSDPYINGYIEKEVDGNRGLMRVQRYSDDTMVEDDETITYQIDTGSDDSNNGEEMEEHSGKSSRLKPIRSLPKKQTKMMRALDFNGT